MVSGYKFLSPTRLHVMGVGKLRTRLQGLPDWARELLFAPSPVNGDGDGLGPRRTLDMRLTRDRAGGWWVHLAFKEVVLEPLPPTGEILGVAFGVNTLVTTSGAWSVPHPHAFEEVVDRISALDQALGRIRRTYFRLHSLEDTPENRRQHTHMAWGSVRGQNLLQERARLHRKARSVRRESVAQAAHALLERADTLVLSDLNLPALARVRGRQILDGGLGLLYRRLERRVREEPHRALIFVRSSNRVADPGVQAQQLRDAALEQFTHGTATRERGRRRPDKLD